jgi:hypothetical protein
MDDDVGDMRKAGVRNWKTESKRWMAENPKRDQGSFIGLWCH